MAGNKRVGGRKKGHSDDYRLHNLISVDYIQNNEMFQKLLGNSNKETFGVNLNIFGGI